MNNQFKIPNTQKRIVRVWAVILVLMLAAAFSPSYLGINGMDGGYAITVVSSFIAFTALLVLGIFFQRAKQFDAILNGNDRLASWYCNTELWQRFVNEDFQAEATAKRSLFFYVSAIAAVVGLLMFLLTGEALFLLIIAGLIVVLAITATLVPVTRARRLRQSKPVVLIGRKGLIVGKIFHYWGHLGAVLDKTDVENIEGMTIISFQYSYPAFNGRQTEIARVPVPDGMEEVVDKIITQLD